LTTLSDILVNTYGDKLKEILSVSMYAIDMEYVEKDQKSITVIQDGSEIAIIPPVSGG
jgi:molybdopterin converting factor small subunit